MKVKIDYIIEKNIKDTFEIPKEDFLKFLDEEGYVINDRIDISDALYDYCIMNYCGPSYVEESLDIYYDEDVLKKEFDEIINKEVLVMITLDITSKSYWMTDYSSYLKLIDKIKKAEESINIPSPTSLIIPKTLILKNLSCEEMSEFRWSLFFNTLGETFGHINIKNLLNE